MQSPPSYRDTSYISLGERRGKSDLARFSLDLSWARAVSDSARSRAYPSPPMSGSPQLPQRRNPDSSDRGHGSYGSSGQDVFPGTQTPQSEISVSGSRGPPLRAYQPEQQPQATYSPYRMEDIQPAPPLPYQQLQQPQQRGPQIAPQLVQHHQQNPGFRPQQGPQPPASFSTPERPPTGEAAEYSSSPRAQRKTKGHVASACVPCKRAHLRCDAQRPCSRCLANGKEDACVDVQHKKRGRPRLRDEREQRYESLGPGYGHPQHEGSMRRPVSLYSPEAAMAPTYGDSVHRSGSYRILKSQGSLAPRYGEHAIPADASMFGGSMGAPRMNPSPEPLCAYLTMEMQVAKATRSFWDTIGIQPVVSRRLQEIVSTNDREKVGRLRRVLEEERREREPTYLPPIFLKYEEDRIIQSVGFGSDEIGQLHLEHVEVMTFQGPEGQQRTLQARFGLAKKESTYFIAAIFQVPATPQTFHQPSPSPYSRDPYGREPQYGYAPQQQFPPNQGPASFIPNPAFGGDPRGDSMAYRPPGPLGMTMPIQTSIPPFSQPQTRPDYSSQAQNPYQTPRSELPQGQPQQHHNLQLPPIRNQTGETSSVDAARRRDDRSNRVDIGGLLEQPRGR